MGIPVLDCPNVRELTSLTGLKTVNENEFMNIAKTKSPLFLYCNSENSFQWIDKNLKYTEIPSSIEMFKDKVTFPDTPMPKGVGFLDKLTSPILLSIKNLINYNI